MSFDLWHGLFSKAYWEKIQTELQLVLKGLKPAGCQPETISARLLFFFKQYSCVIAKKKRFSLFFSGLIFLRSFCFVSLTNSCTIKQQSIYNSIFIKTSAWQNKTCIKACMFEWALECRIFEKKSRQKLFFVVPNNNFLKIVINEQYE